LDEEAVVEAYKTNAIGSDTDTPLFDLTGADFVDQIDAEGKGTGLIVYTGEKADNIINEYTGYYFGTETNGDTASLQAAYNDDGSLKGVYLQQYKGTTDTTYGVAISAIGSTSFAALDTMVTSTAQPSPIPCTELSTVIASLQSAKNYTATTALSYLDSTGAAVTDATKLKTLEDGFVGYIPDTFTAYTDGASFYTTEASDGAIDAYLMHDSKPYEVYNTDSTGAILADGKFSADDLSTYGSDVWSITPNIGVVESSALATLNVFSATVSGTVTTYVYDYVDNADLQLEMNYQHAMIGPSFSNNILPDLVKYGYVMNNVAKADSAAKSLELTTTVRFYNSSLSGYFYLNFDTIFSAVGTTVVPTIDASKITWPTAA
jgi:hypothetical protein